MKYTAVVLSVADVKAARGFYEDLFGLEVCQDYGSNVSFTCGLSLQQEFDWLGGLQKERIGKKSNNMELCFETEDLDHFLEQLRRYPGAERLGDVVEHGWGQRVVRFYDLDGHLVEVGEDMAFRLSRDFSALRYCTVPSTALRIRTAKMTMVLSTFSVRAEMTAAMRRMMTSRSLNCSRKRTATLLRLPS